MVTNSVSRSETYCFWSSASAFNLRDIEQALDQINRLASNKVTTHCPEMILEIRAWFCATSRLRFGIASASLDNQGAETTGKNQAGFTWRSTIRSHSTILSAIRTARAFLSARSKRESVRLADVCSAAGLYDAEY